MNPFEAPPAAEAPAADAPLTPSTVARMSQDEWARTFMPSLVTPAEPEAASEPAAEPAADTADSVAAAPERGPDGKFVAKTEAAPDAPAPETPAEPAPDTPKLPFAAIGPDDAPVDPSLLASMRVSMKANGAEVVVPLPDLVRQAQSAAGATRQVNELRPQLQARESELAALKADVDALEAAMLRALTDDDALAALRAQYQAYTAPEAELARLKAQREAEAAQQAKAQQEQEHSEAATSFLNGLNGEFAAIMATYPTVTPQELLGQFSLDTAQWAVNGAIPPSKWAEVEAYVRGSLSAFAQQRHTANQTLRTQADAARQQAEKAAADAKRQMAAAVRPSGTPGSTAPSKPQISSIKDATAYALAAFTTPSN